MDLLLTALQEQKLKRNFRHLKVTMEPTEVIDHLYSHDILSDSVYADINAARTRQEKAEKIIQSILRKDQNAYQVFVDSLNATGQEFLAACLDVDAPDVLSPGIDGSAVDGPALPAVPPVSDDAVDSGSGDTEDDDSGGESPSQALDWQVARPLLAVSIRPCIAAGAARQLSRLAYGMSHPVRGRALLVCNSEFAKEAKLSRRLGADNDLVNVAALFSGLGFVVDQLRDASRDAMFEVLNRERRRPEHAAYGAFVLYLSSHGTADAVLGTDGRELLLSNVYDMFDGRGCPALARKPKLIVVEASRGARLDRGRVVPGGSSGARTPSTPAGDFPAGQPPLVLGVSSCTVGGGGSSLPPGLGGSAHGGGRVFQAGNPNFAGGGGGDGSAGSLSDETQSQQPEQRHHGPVSRTTACKADFMVAFSTFSGYTSLRSPQYGCWFSRAVVEVFSNRACDHHVAELLKLVRRKMARIVTKLGYMQICTTTDTLTKEMYFFPLVDPGSLTDTHS